MGVGGRHSELDAGAGPRDRQTAIGQPPRLTCIHEVLRLVGVAAGIAAGSQVRAWEAGHLNVKSVQGCCSDRDSGSRVVRERHQKWVVAGCSSAEPVHGECVTFVTDLTGRWRAVVPVGPYYAGR